PLEQSRAVRDAMAHANRQGVVAIGDLELDGGLELWQKLDSDRRLTFRVHVGFPAEKLGAVRTLGVGAGFGSHMLRLGAAKVFMDGTLGSQTAWMLDGTGDVLTTAAELEDIVREATAGAIDVEVHAIGDGANRAALDAFDATRELWQEALRRPRIEHVQC